MNATTAIKAVPGETKGILDIAHELGPIFARRAEESTDEDRFVADNFELLKASGLVAAGVPRALGGGGADVDELAAMLRTLAHHCGSTALAFSMHTHQVAIPAWRWTHQKAMPVEPLLKRVAGERIILLTSGGSDWIGGSGKAEKVEGGYRITARKVFTSSSPIGDLFMTGAVLENEGEPPTVLHFGLPMSSPHVKVLDTWRTLGMRGTGSHDVQIDGHVVPEAAVAARRKAGEWHPLFHIIGTIAFPLVYAVYLGVAESARDIAWPQDVLPKLGLDAYTTVVALAHVGHIDDEALKLAVKSQCLHIGALGSSRNHAKRVERLKAAGLTDAEIARIKAPIGLDIGAQSPAEVAIAIMAEIVLAVRGTKRKAG